MSSLADCLVVGGGVVGLSLAYELAADGRRVALIDRGPPGREASWAGAGILPPAPPAGPGDPYGQLARLSYDLHPRWSRQLLEQTGIDNGYRRCGAIYLAEPAADADLLHQLGQWRASGITAEPIDARRLAELEPQLALGKANRSAACWLPDEAQLRNPRHLKALHAACAARGVAISAGISAEDFEIHNGRVQAIRTSSGRLLAGQYCIAAGPWSRSLLARLGIDLAIKPIRGQIVLLDGYHGLRHIINQGPRYLVPRGDGRILVGSTEEDAGFDKRTTAEAVAHLVAFALALVPGLGCAQLAQCWAGLRPATSDGLPYLGVLPGTDNLFVAAGHFRAGITLSCATAVIMARLMRGEPPGIDLRPFSLTRL